MLRRGCFVKSTHPFSFVGGIASWYTANHLCQRSHFVRLAEAMRSGRSAGIGPANSKERPTPSHTIPDLEFHQYPACWERVLDREAWRRIQASVPAFAQTRLMTRSA